MILVSVFQKDLHEIENLHFLLSHSDDILRSNIDQAHSPGSVRKE